MKALSIYRTVLSAIFICLQLTMWLMFCALMGLWPREVFDRANGWFNGPR